MSIEQSNSVDLIALDEQGNLVLTISDHLEWQTDASDHLLLLQDKLNAYLRFIESGEVLGAHPRAAGKPVVIDVVLKFPANDQGVKFLEAARGVVEGAGIGFSYRVFEDDV